MTPAARIQSAIELLDIIETEMSTAGQPADGILQAYFRSRRYAGSKDRAAVRDLVYGVLRNWAPLTWHGAGGGRGFVLGQLNIMEGQDRSQLEALFDGSKYGPAALEAEELDRLGGRREAPPQWVRLGYPEWLEPQLQACFGKQLEIALEGLSKRAPLDLRVNRLKTDRSSAREALAEADMAAKNCELSPVGLRLAERRVLGALDLPRLGHIEIQDEGSQLAALLVGARPGMQVVDLCAGAGGKTLAMAASMNNKGQIYAFDSDPDRLKAMVPRLRRAGARNVQLQALGGWRTPKGLSGGADRVLVDAPCSGTGTWRRSPDAKWRLTPDILSRQAERQGRLLDQGAACVTPGGWLVYVVCSFLGLETVEQTAAFLARHGDFHTVPPQQAWEQSLDCALPADAVRGNEFLFLPHLHGTDAFYVAVLERS